MKRTFDLMLAVVACLFLSPVFAIIYILCKLTDSGPFLYWSRRVGTNSTVFLMPKIRTMKVDTPQVATHLLMDSQNYLTAMGKFLRRSSLDEIPQLFSII